MFSILKKLLILTVLTVPFYAGIESSHSATQEGREEKAAAKYYCPMHPQVVSDKPGECPICHMRLAPMQSPVSIGKTVESRIPIEMTDSSRMDTLVKTETVDTKSLIRNLRVSGIVAHDPEVYETQIDYLREKRLTSEVKRDVTPLAPQTLKQSLTTLEKMRVWFFDRGYGEEWLKELEARGTPDARLIHRHPNKEAWIYLQIRERDASLVRVGDKATLALISAPTEKITGDIRYIDRLLNEDTRTVRAHVLVEALPERFLPRSLVEGLITADLGEALVIPDEAPLFTGGRWIVFVAENGAYTPREVVLGERVNGYYPVKSGLKQGESIASSGVFFLDSESRLRASFASVSHGSHDS